MAVPAINFWPRCLPQATYHYTQRLLLPTWTVAAVAEAARVSCHTVQRVPAGLFMYHSTNAPRRRKLGPPHKMTMAARNALAELVRQKPSLHQYEMAEFI